MFTPTKMAIELRTDELRLRKILDIVAAPPAGLTGWSQEQYAEVKGLVEQYLHPGSNQVGADPEFEIYIKHQDGRMEFANASNFFPRDGQLGTDTTGSPTGELRPPPGSPEKVVENVRNLLAEAKRRLPAGYIISAGAGRSVPTGGHIHISGRPCPEILITKLDTFVNIPLRSKANVTIRDRHGYGRPRDVRTQNHGWEYRSPCSWLAHPDIAHGALAITWQMSQMSERDLEKLSTRESLYKAMGSRAHIARKFYETIDQIESLEQVDVFAAWGISEEFLQSVRQVIARTFRYPLRFSSDRVRVALSEMNLGSDSIEWTISRYDGFSRTRTIYVHPAVAWWIRNNIQRIPRTLRIETRDDLSAYQMSLSTSLADAITRSRRGRGRSTYNVMRRILSSVFATDLNQIIRDWQTSRQTQQSSRLSLRLDPGMIEVR